MKPSGAHTHPGSGGLALAVAVIAVAAVAVPVIHALTNLIEVLAVVILGLGVLGVAALVCLLRLQGHQGQARTIPPALPPRVYGSASVQGRSEPRALPARQELHLHLHGVSAEDVAAIIARQNGGQS